MSDQTSNLPILERYKNVIFLVVTVALFSGIGTLLFRQPEPAVITIIPPGPTLVPSPTLSPTPTATPGPYAVYVTGAVAEPEVVVTLPFGSRVLDALDAAGGALDEADLSRVNLAQRLDDGDHIEVPTRSADSSSSTADQAIAVVTSTPGELLVYVVGAVRRSEAMASVPVGSRVADAIEAAGGALDSADLSAVNLSQILNDGDLVYVPAMGTAMIQTPTPNHPLLVHVNYATLEELDTLPGFGAVLAQAVVDYRTEHGPFSSLADLDAVEGIGPSKLEAIRELVVFD